MIFLEMHQVRRDLHFESENRFNLILVKSCSFEVVDAYIRRVDIKSIGCLISIEVKQGQVFDIEFLSH